MTRLIPHLLFAPLVIFLFVQNIATTPTEQMKVKGDAYGYMTMALNLVHYDVLSKACEDFSVECPVKDRIPTYYREPMLSSLFALLIEISPSVNNLSRTESFTSPGMLHPELYSLMEKLAWGEILVTALSCMSIVFLLTSSWICSYLAFYLVSTSPIMSWYTQFFLTENTAAMFFALTTLLLVYAMKSKRLPYFLAGGIGLGLLALTRAVYSYMWPAFIFVFAFAWFFGKESRSKVVKGSLLFLVGFYCTTAVWMTRNYIQFHDFAIAQRGGRALTIRTFFNQMSYEELAASFYLWAPYKPANKHLEENFPEGITTRFDRRNDDGFYRSARAHGAQVMIELGDIEGDQALKKEAIGTILSDPIKHVLVSASFAVRGMFVEGEKKFGELFTVERFWVNVFIFGSFFLATLWSLATRNYILLMALFPALFSYLFHASFSNSRTRYNQPILPALWISSVFVFYTVCAWAGALFGFFARLFGRSSASPKHSRSPVADSNA